MISGYLNRLETGKGLALYTVLVTLPHGSVNIDMVGGGGGGAGG